jgi:hypothetical protein
LEGVASSGEGLESCVAFRLLNAVAAEIGNTESWFHIGAISGGALAITVTVSLVSKMDKKYSGTLMRFKGKYPSTQKHLYQHPWKQLYSN